VLLGKSDSPEPFEIWWGEAPERTDDYRGAANIRLIERGYYTTKRAEPWSILGHGSARLSALYIDCLGFSLLPFGEMPGLSGASPPYHQGTPLTQP
jgi:hypothetical protein